jgi:ElaB/YqjD/DUF883 family membrane-anchored ribosome-binding protein
MARETRAGAGGSAVAEVEEKGRELVSNAQEQVHRAGERARDRVRDEVDRRSTELGDQSTSLAAALRKAGDELEGEDKPGTAQATRQIADQVDRVGGYLKRANAENMLDDAERIARQRPWVAAGAGVIVGFLASRFLKASSSDRYRRQQETNQPRSGNGQAGTYRGPALESAEPAGRFYEPAGGTRGV